MSHVQKGLKKEWKIVYFGFETRIRGARTVRGQGCSLRKITRSPKVPNHEILSAQYLAFITKVHFSTHPKAKLSCLWHPVASRP